MGKPFLNLSDCYMCPRSCGANRQDGRLGYCKAGAGLNVASVVIHHGEEPVISGKNGICNVFFSHCNLRCSFCQNYQISQPKTEKVFSLLSLKDVVHSIILALDNGCSGLGFVSPSHMVHQVIRIHDAVIEQGYNPIIVYNSNAYDLPEALDYMEDRVDVWLPDFKYMDPNLSRIWSDAEDYPEVALQALKRMYKHRGSTLRMENGLAVSGMIIRHLVMPGAIQNSLDVLTAIAEHLGTDVAISLMSQYSPNHRGSKYGQLNRPIFASEYQRVQDHLENLGFYKGWVQNLDSDAYYLPDFYKDNPFECTS